MHRGIFWPVRRHLVTRKPFVWTEEVTFLLGIAPGWLDFST